MPQIAPDKTCSPSVGLALGAGVVRGMAHIGVMDVLQECGIRVDFMAGTSAGAVVAALYTGGIDMPDIIRIAKSLSWKKLVYPTMRRGSLLTHRKLGEYVESLVGPKRVCDMQPPLVVVATDFHTGEEVLLRDEPIGLAVCASSAMPGLFAPVRVGERLLVDGFLVNSVPSNVVRQMGASLVISSSVRSGGVTDSNGPIPAYQLVWQTVDLLVRHQIETVGQRSADVMIETFAPHLNAFHFRDTEAFIEAGREAALRSIPAIREAIARLPLDGM